MKSFLYALWEVVEVGLIAVLTVFIVRNFLVQPFLVSGASMEPTFQSGDYLLIDELAYRFRAPERGEVVVFRYPGNENVYYIKRIIGLPGEAVAFRNGAVEVKNSEHPDGVPLDEAYLSPGVPNSGESVTLKDGEYFLMGDNRPYSFDSRSWGPLAHRDIVGLVRFRLWPFNKVMAVEKPAY